MKKTNYIFIFIILGLIACNQREKKIKIGIILPLTGNGALYGKDLQKGIEFAYEESEVKDKITLIYEDDAADTRKGISALNNLRTKGVKIIIGGVMSNVANGLLPIINKEKILLLSPKATDPKLSNDDDYFFRIWPTDDVDGKVSSQYIIDSLGLKKVAVLYPNIDYGVGLRNVFVENISIKGGIVIFDESYQNGQTDFRTQLLKIKQLNPDVLFLPAYFKEATIILKQLNEFDCNFYVSGVSSFYEKDIVNNSGKLKDKVFFSYPLYSVISQNPTTVEFIERFKHKDGDIPNAFVAHGYESFKVLENSIKLILDKKQDVSSNNVKDELKGMDIFRGVTGDFRFDQNGNAIKDLQIIWLKDI